MIPPLAERLRAVMRVLADAPLFRNMATTDLEWHARPYMNESPEKWLAKAVETLREAAAALSQQEVAFKAGYHCRWHKGFGKYCFDPAMSPGDPDGAYAAWLKAFGLTAPPPGAPRP